MANFTVYEYVAVDVTGKPVEPPSHRSVQALGSAVQCTSGTVAVRVTAAVDMIARFSGDGSAATTDDLKIAGGLWMDFGVSAGSRPYIYGIAG